MGQQKQPEQPSRQDGTKEDGLKGLGEKLRKKVKSAVTPPANRPPSGPDNVASDENNRDETPKIAEKVKFWEEQDRINTELIPRVVKIHELVTDHIAGHQDASVQIGAAEARLIERVNKARMQAMVVAGVSLVVAVVAIILSLVL